MTDFLYWLTRTVKFVHVFSLLLLGLCFSMFFYILSSRFPADKINMSSDIKICVIGTLGVLVGYWYGSSKVSEIKEEKKPTT